MDTIESLGKQAATKLDAQRQSLASHFVRSMLAGMYVGVCIVLIFILGGQVAAQFPGLSKLVMGLCFGGALSFVIFGGSELFTGCNMVLTCGVLTGKASLRDLGANWAWTWLGNLAGAVLLAVMAVRSGVLDAVPAKQFVLGIVRTKMTLPPEQLFWRAVLANWLVCLAVWMAARVQSETARLILIAWCMLTFVASGYEHSIANMSGLMLGLLLPHDSVAGITWGGYAYNLSVATLGNIVGGAGFVAGLYWLSSPRACARVKQPAVFAPSAIAAAPPA